MANSIAIHKLSLQDEYPPAVELRKMQERQPLPSIAPGTVDPACMCGDEPGKQALAILSTFNSKTYIIPLSYVCDKMSLGAYEFGVEGARGLNAHMASQEPDRYAKLAAAGFPVLDSRLDHGTDLLHHLLERAGGHYVDTGATELLAEGKCGIKANVEPVAFTETGLRFSDGSTMDADAIIWCTGFADTNVRAVTAEVLGGRPNAEDMASRLDATWGLDEEGEVRGLWKRQLKIDNYWVMAGYTSQHRWHSKTLALQIKAELEGILPPAYRETPKA